MVVGISLSSNKWVWNKAQLENALACMGDCGFLFYRLIFYPKKKIVLFLFAARTRMLAHFTLLINSFFFISYFIRFYLCIWVWKYWLAKHHIIISFRACVTLLLLNALFLFILNDSQTIAYWIISTFSENTNTEKKTEPHEIYGKI